MILLGCCVPGGSLMPEGVAEVPKSPAEELAAKCRLILETGFDFTECAAGMLTGLNEEALAYLEEENSRSPLKLRAVNSLFPGHFRLAEEGEMREAVDAHLTKLFTVMKRFGIRYAVLGSGAARKIPADADREEGVRRLDAYLSWMADKAAAYGIIVVIEPLRKAETNVLVTVRESGETAERIGKPSMQLLCDAFHMAEEKTDIADMADFSGMILHCHMAESPNRSYPGKSDSADLSYNRRFAEKLAEIGYEGGVSAECGFADFRSDIKAAYAYMKEIFGR